MNYKQCAQELLSNDSILILTHRNPDGDTSGCAGALCRALRRTGKRAYIRPNPGFNRKVLPYISDLIAPEDFRPRYVVAVDVASEGQMQGDWKGEVDLCIDHHPSNTMYARQTFLKGDKAACGEIMLELIRCMMGDITAEEATLLYIAVSTDTGCFQYSNANAATFKAVSELLRAGADSISVNRSFFRQVSAARMKLEGMIYDSLRFFRDGKIAAVTITQEMLIKAGTTDDDYDDLSALAGRAEGSEVAITLREEADGRCRLSLRSGENVNVSEICQVFGGGGHARAAGCSIQGTPEYALEMMIQVIDEVWK